MSGGDHNQGEGHATEPTTDRPVTHLMIPLNDTSTGCCSKPVRDLPNDGSHYLTFRPIEKTCDGTGRVRGEVCS